MTRLEDEVLIGALVKNGQVQKEDLARFDGKAEQSFAKKGITKTIIDLLKVDEVKIAEIIAKEFDVPYMPSVDGQTELHLENLPKENLQKYRVAPIFLERKELTVAFVDPPYKSVIELLERITELKVIPVIVTVGEFTKLFQKQQHENKSPKMTTKSLQNLDVFRRGAPSSSESKSNFGVESPIDVLNNIVESAITTDASDIHFENTRDGLLNVRFRVNGVLRRTVTLAKSYCTSIPAVIKQSSNLDALGKKKVQEGQAKLTIRGKNIYTRVNIIPTSLGEKITLRILNKILKVRGLDELGMSYQDLGRLRELLLMQHDSVLLFVGPAGCGKTTTMYAALNELKDVSRNISTIENPIESQLDGVNQTSAGAGKKISYLEGIRSLFHHDVDVMAVGEIRDKEEAELLVEAGLTGLSALSTVQAGDAIRSLFRLENLGLEKRDLALAIRGIVAQKFARKVCTHCSETYRPSKKILEMVGLARLPEKISLTKGKGCEVCSTSGYDGRIPLFETLIVNDEVGTCIHNGSPYLEIRTAAEASGFTSMRYDGLRKAIAGLTTLEEVIRVT